MPKTKSIRRQASVSPRAASVSVERDDHFDELAAVAFHRLLVETQGVLGAAMENGGVSQAQVAAKLGVSKSTVCRYLNDDANLTLRTIARIATAAGDRFHVGSHVFEHMTAAGQVGRLYTAHLSPRAEYTITVETSGRLQPAGEVSRITAEGGSFFFIQHAPQSETVKVLIPELAEH
jgi:transcriptional regulator with XRE-family HTH domain